LFDRPKPTVGCSANGRRIYLPTMTYILNIPYLLKQPSYTSAQIRISTAPESRFWWPRGPRRRSTSARLLGLWVRIPRLSCMSIFYECCVLSGRCLSHWVDPSSRGVLPTFVYFVYVHVTSTVRRLRPR